MKKYLLSILLSLLIAACSSSDKLGKDENPLLLDYNVTISQGGGFTGERQGFIIDSTGTVNNFSRMLKSDIKTTYKGKMSDEQIAELNKLFPSILNTRYNENGNMTTSVLLKNKDLEFRFSWGGTDPGQNVPVELRTFYDKINFIIKNLKD